MREDTLTVSTDHSQLHDNAVERSRDWLPFVIAVLLFVAMAAGSLLPPQYKTVLHTHGRFHSWIHVAAFGLLAFVTVRGVRSSRTQFLAFAGCLAFGWAIEVLEFLTYHALFEWRDCFTDAVGVTFATLLALLLPS